LARNHGGSWLFMVACLRILHNSDKSLPHHGKLWASRISSGSVLLSSFFPRCPDRGTECASCRTVLWYSLGRISCSTTASSPCPCGIQWRHIIPSLQKNPQQFIECAASSIASVHDFCKVFSNFCTVLNVPPHKVSVDSSSSAYHKVEKMFLTWKERTDGTYRSLRDHLDNYSVFSGRNVLVRYVLTFIVLF